MQGDHTLPLTPSHFPPLQTSPSPEVPGSRKRETFAGHPDGENLIVCRTCIQSGMQLWLHAPELLVLIDAFQGQLTICSESSILSKMRCTSQVEIDTRRVEAESFQDLANKLRSRTSFAELARNSGICRCAPRRWQAPPCRTSIARCQDLGHGTVPLGTYRECTD